MFVDAVGDDLLDGRRRERRQVFHEFYTRVGFGCEVVKERLFRVHQMTFADSNLFKLYLQRR